MFALLTSIVVDQPESPGRCCLLLGGFGVWSLKVEGLRPGDATHGILVEGRKTSAGHAWALAEFLANLRRVSTFVADHALVNGDPPLTGTARRGLLLDPPSLHERKRDGAERPMSLLSYKPAFRTRRDAPQ